MSNRIAIGVLIALVLMTPVMAVLEFTAGGPVQYAVYRWRLATINDPEQGWATRAKIIDDMASGRSMSKTFAYEQTIQLINSRNSNASFWFFEAARVAARKPAFIGADREALAHALHVTRTPGDAVDTYDISGQFNSAYRFTVAHDHGIVIGVGIVETKTDDEP